MDTFASVLNGNTAYAFTWTIIHSLWQCTLIALVLGISLAINRHQSANGRYLQGIIALIMCVTVSVATYAHLYHSVTNATNVMQTPNTLLQYSDSLWQQIYSLLNKNVQYILLVWLTGFTLQFIRYARDFFEASMLRYRGCENVNPEWFGRCQQLAHYLNLSKVIQVKNSCRVSSICVLGHFKPVILLPIGLLTSLTTEQVEALLLHELAHIQRNDYVINAIQSFVRLLYFFNPAVMWISTRIDRERENSCDDIAVKYCGCPTLYAKSLTSISELESRLATVLAANKNKYQMLPRVKRLFSNNSGIAKSMEQLISGLFACGLVLAMNVSANEFSLPTIKTPAPTVDNLSVETELPALNPQPVKPAESPAKISAKVQQPQSTSTTVEKVNVIAATQSLDFASKNSTTRNTQLAQAAETPPPRTPTAADGEGNMEIMDSPEFNSLYISSKFSLPLSRKIYVEKASVQFADIWMDRFRASTSANYRTLIEDDYGTLLTKSIKKQLTKTGWQVVDKKDSGTVIVKPELIDLYIYAPETSGIKQTIIAMAGQSGVKLLYSTPQGQPIMKIVDYRNTPQSAGSPFVANRATNFHYFKKLIDSWSKSSTQYLNGLMELVEQQKS
ncbi:M56 family metallopeptidase [Teredinibacter haidensis]|uniref:M56 family metallopeptidase n=1 Tax=Teredinibacter haidensis TaxID=2731755 RepID=UPI000948C881|nr:M56 family metallopeptidase [Teredinibacter haidensis]